MKHSDDNEFDLEKHSRELDAFMRMGDDLFREGAESNQIRGVTSFDLLQGVKIVPGPQDSTGEVPVYLVKVADEAPPIPVSMSTSNVVGVPPVALAIILMHRLQNDAAHEDATPIDRGAARAMAKTIQWLGAREQIDLLME